MKTVRCVFPRRITIVMLAFSFGAIGCGSQSDPPATANGRSMQIELTSSAFADGQPIPSQYTGQGDDLSPPLAWSDPPDGTRELALVCDDPDAPAGTWVHWVVCKIPATATGLPGGLGKLEPTESDLDGLVEGRNSFGTLGYRGPMPPSGSGPHRYYFRLYALDCELTPDPDLDKPSLLRAIDGHILGEGQLMGTYQR